MFTELQMKSFKCCLFIGACFTRPGSPLPFEVSDQSFACLCGCWRGSRPRDLVLITMQRSVCTTSSGAVPTDLWHHTSTAVNKPGSS